jgi:cytochrome c oxidase subunit 2
VRKGPIVRIMAVGVLAGIVVALIAVLVPWLPTSASEEMDRITFVFWFATVICIAIFALVAGVTIYSVIRFRVAPDDESDGPPIHGHTGLEIAWTAVPAVLVTAIAIVSAVVLAKNDDLGENPLKVDVTAQQFAWSFKYPSASNLVSGELALPKGRHVELTLNALDVIHSFWVPEMGQKQDAVPGIVTKLVITPTRTGSFTLECTELCGLGHATMRAAVRVLEPAAFDKWLKEKQSGAAGGTDGAALFTQQGCNGCHTFKPAGSTAQVGPDLDNLAADAKKAGKPLEDYTKESIRDPSAYVVPGYQAGVMPAFGPDTLSDEQLDALVQYLTGSSGQGG